MLNWSTLYCKSPSSLVKDKRQIILHLLRDEIPVILSWHLRIYQSFKL